MTEAPLTHLTATRLTELMQTGQLSVREVVEAHLRRIDDVNPRVNAIVSLDGDRAMDHAEALDRDFAERRQDGLPPLYGLPIAHKDTLAAAGLPATSGCSVFRSRIATHDHVIVEREKAAGAVTLGKTNVPELGLGSHTFNPVFGRTHNPWDLSRSAGGSSGGAAAALAARMLPTADGSDTGGSLRTPASFCGVAGLRPTPGTVPSWPDAQPWSRLSVKGPLARTIEDLRLLLSVQAGDDPRSPVGRGAQIPATDAPAQLEGLRVAWTPDLGLGLPLEPDVLAALEPVVRTLSSAGAAIEQAAPDLTGAADAFRVLRAWQLEAALGALVDEHADELADSVLWNVGVGRRLTGPEVGRAELESAALHTRTREFFEDVDLLLCPVVQTAPFPGEWDYPHELAGVPMDDYLEWMTLPSVVTMMGCPALSLPVAFTADGLPVGLQLIGPPRSDRQLLAIAQGIEQLMGVADALPPCGTIGA